MATEARSISTTPVNLVSELSLTVGTTYTVQNTGNSDLLLREGANSPAATLELDHWNVIMARLPEYGIPYQTGQIIPKTGEGIWARARGGNTVAVVNEVS